MKHYVYTLADPRDGVIFYVGKGQRDRAWVHEREVRKGRVGHNYPKFAKIREIVQAELTVTVSIVARYETADPAYAHEARLIAEIGLENLTNITPGGGGQPVTVMLTAGRRARGMAMAAIRNMGSFPEWVRSCRAYSLLEDPLRTYCRFKDAFTEQVTGVRGTEEASVAKVDELIASGNLLNSIFGKSKISEEDVLAVLARLPASVKQELMSACRADKAFWAAEAQANAARG